MGTLTARMFNALGSRDVEEGALPPAVGFSAGQYRGLAVMEERCPIMISSNTHAVT